MAQSQGHSPASDPGHPVMFHAHHEVITVGAPDGSEIQLGESMVTPVFYSEVPLFGVVLWWLLSRPCGAGQAPETVGCLSENHSVVTADQDPSPEGLRP